MSAVMLTEETVKRIANEVADKLNLPEKRVMRVYGSRNPMYHEVFCHFAQGRPETMFELFMGHVKRIATEAEASETLRRDTIISIDNLSALLLGRPHDGD